MKKHAGFISAMVLMVGCGGTTETKTDVSFSRSHGVPSANQPSEVTVSDGDQPTADAAPAVMEVSLRISTFDALQATIAKHKGKVVVCDFWSTSCEPCVREFPQLVALSQKYSADKVVCISASLDFDGLNKLDEYKGPVLEFLKEKKATIDNVLFSEEDTVIYEKLKIASIPAVFVYAADGSRAKVFDESSGKEFTYEKDINPLVAELVAASK